MKKIICIILCVLIFTSLCVVSVSAQSVSQTSGAPLVNVPDGYNLFEFSKLYSSGGLKVSQNNSAAKIKNDSGNGGVLISGTPEEISKLYFELADTVNLGSYTAGRLVFNAVCGKNTDSAAEVIIDNDASKVISINSAKQRESGDWSGEKNNCADISALKLSGAHSLGFRLKFSEDAENIDTSVMLKNMLFVAYSVPVVDVNIDESRGTIEAMNSDEDHKTRCYGNMTINIPEGYQPEYTDEKLETATYEFDYIRGRGNSTWLADKKPYKIKLKKKANLLGMGANKHWGLIANYYDYTLLRNKYTYWLGAKMGMEFTPKCAFVDVVMNGSYLGSYCLSELVRVDESRVNIDNLEDTPEVTGGEELTGGYLVSMDALYDDFIIETEHHNFRSESPDFEENFVEEQYNYIKNYLIKTDEAVYSENLRDSDGVLYSDYIDVDSMIDYFIVQGTSENGDAFVNGSTYLYKRRGGKLYWGPLWDFDYVAWWADAMWEENEFGSYNVENYPWFKNIFLNDEEFKEKFIARLKEVDEIIRQSAQDGGQVDAYAKQVYLSQYANHLLMPIDMEQYLPNTIVAKGATFDSEIERLKRTLIKRADWQDSNTDEIILERDNIRYIFLVDDSFYNSLYKENLDAYSSLIDEPKKENLTFDGWYMVFGNMGEISIDEYLENYIDSDLLPGDKIFYAKWKDKSEPEETSQPTEAATEAESEPETEAEASAAASTTADSTGITAATDATSSTTKSAVTASSSNNNSGAVQTGENSFAVIALLILLAGIVIYYNYAKANKPK